MKLARIWKLHARIVLIEDGAPLVAEQVVVVRHRVGTRSSECDVVNPLSWISLPGAHSIEDASPPQTET